MFLFLKPKYFSLLKKAFVAIGQLPGPSHAPVIFISIVWHIVNGWVGWNKDYGNLVIPSVYSLSLTLCLSPLRSVCECMSYLALYYAGLFFYWWDMFGWKLVFVCVFEKHKENNTPQDRTDQSSPGVSGSVCVIHNTPDWILWCAEPLLLLLSSCTKDNDLAVLHSRFLLQNCFLVINEVMLSPCNCVVRNVKWNVQEFSHIACLFSLCLCMKCCSFQIWDVFLSTFYVDHRKWMKKKISWQCYVVFFSHLDQFESKSTSVHSVQPPQSCCNVWHTFSFINWVKLCSHFKSFVTYKWPGSVPVITVTAWSHDFGSWT